MDSEYRSVVQRVHDLEKRYRRLKAVLVLMSAAFVLMVLWGQTSSPQIVSARVFQVVNEQGEVRGMFFAQNDGAVLSLLDPSGNSAGVVSSVGRGGEAFVSLNYSGKNQGMVVGPTGMVFNHEDGKKGTVITPVGLGIFDGQSQTIAWAAP